MHKQDINRREIEEALSRGTDRGVCEAHWAVCQGADDRGAGR
ncbi:MAG: hypothetical protein K0Q73_4517 [Paenibacillus sp.]|nr:hypothetical protein [Paenibacillus sp.]